MSAFKNIVTQISEYYMELGVLIGIVVFMLLITICLTLTRSKKQTDQAPSPTKAEGTNQNKEQNKIDTKDLCDKILKSGTIFAASYIRLCNLLSTLDSLEILFHIKHIQIGEYLFTDIPDPVLCKFLRGVPIQATDNEPLASSIITKLQTTRKPIILENTHSKHTHMISVHIEYNNHIYQGNIALTLGIKNTNTYESATTKQLPSILLASTISISEREAAAKTRLGSKVISLSDVNTTKMEPKYSIQPADDE